MVQCTNATWVGEESVSLSAVRVYRAARQAVATLERDLDKLGRFQDPTEGGRFQKGEKVVTTQLVETASGLRVKTVYGWVSMVAVSGVVLLEPWKDPRTIDTSGLTARKNPPSHRTAQEFAEVDGIWGIPRFPAMKPFHGAVLRNPGLRMDHSPGSVRRRKAPMRHGPLLVAPPTSIPSGSGLITRAPERLAGSLPELDKTLDFGWEREMKSARAVAKEQLIPLSSWSDHLQQSRQRFGLATPPSLPAPTNTFRRLHPAPARTPRQIKPRVFYSPGSAMRSRPEPLPRGGLADKKVQSARARLGGGSAPLLSFADSQDNLTDVLSSSSLSRSIAVAPLANSHRTALKLRSVAPPARPVQPMSKPPGGNYTSDPHHNFTPGMCLRDCLWLQRRGG